MENAVVRAFIAVELSTEIHASIEALTRLLNQQRFAVRWTPVKNVHLTLKFLGDVQPERLAQVKVLMQTTCRDCSPFLLSVGGLGVFPHARKPRIIWVGLAETAVLGSLWNKIEVGCRQLGFEAEVHGFSPHVTIGRVAQSAGDDELHRIGEKVGKMQVGRLGVMDVRRVTLFRSELMPGGPIYTRLYEAGFGA